MASRYRSVSQPAFSIIKSTITKPSSKLLPSSFLLKTRSPVTARQVPFVPFRVAASPALGGFSSARLTSCLGIDSSRSRSLSQGMLCNANSGV
ncbi:hypothetical protein glysoja_017793 [Glycine soja]|nr:hypothetical protein glysoja_017793 [Glycine soja]